jgi:hypothetical protein
MTQISRQNPPLLYSTSPPHTFDNLIAGVVCIFGFPFLKRLEIAAKRRNGDDRLALWNLPTHPRFPYNTLTKRQLYDRLNQPCQNPGMTKKRISLATLPSQKTDCEEMANRQGWTLVDVEELPPSPNQIFNVDCVFQGKTEFPRPFNETDADWED